jgi:hypothetical protein
MRAPLCVAVPPSATAFQPLMDTHHRYRTRHAAPVLSWDGELAAAARAYALQCKRGTDPINRRRNWGENIHVEAGNPKVRRRAGLVAANDVCLGRVVGLIWEQAVCLGQEQVGTGSELAASCWYCGHLHLGGQIPGCCSGFAYNCWLHALQHVSRSLTNRVGEATLNSANSTAYIPPPHVTEHSVPATNHHQPQLER